MTSYPLVDVNLYVYNDISGIRLVLESLLAQTWPNVALTLFDDGSTDGTAEVLDEYAARFKRARMHHNSCRTGEVTGFQRALRAGDADFVVPKTGDDPLAPNFIASVMEVLLAHPGCGMCHAGGLVFKGEGAVQRAYPPSDWLSAVDDDPIARAAAVMRTYASSPSLYGIYRRSVTDRASPIIHRAGWDHAFLAEIALYGEIRHVPELLYWRRDGGRSVFELAPRVMLATSQGIPVDGAFAEARWRTPLISTAYGHFETFAAARISEDARQRLLVMVPKIFRERWLPRMLFEAGELRRALPALMARAAALDPPLAGLAAARLIGAIEPAEAILPDEDFGPELAELVTLLRGARRAPPVSVREGGHRRAAVDV